MRERHTCGPLRVGDPVPRIRAAATVDSPKLQTDSVYGVPVKRLASVAAVVLTAFGAGQTVARASSEPPCRTLAQRSHINAVFGHFATLAGAKAYEAKAAAKVFKGLQVVNNGCGDYEVFIGGADSSSQQSSFYAEVRKAGLHVSYQQSAPPLQYAPNHVIGVLGSFRSVARANALMWALSDRGFWFLDLARAPTRWLVVMPQVPIKKALSVAKEVATAGFHVQFQPGVK